MSPECRVELYWKNWWSVSEVELGAGTVFTMRLIRRALRRLDVSSASNTDPQIVR